MKMRSLVLAALIAVLVAFTILWFGETVAPCLGPGPQYNAVCVADWQAHKTILNHLADLGFWPIALGTFGVLVGAMALVQIARRPTG